MANLTQHQILQRLTRLQGPEQEQQVNFAALGTTVLPSSLKTDKFIWGIIIRFHGRIAVGGTAFTPLVNALWNLLQEVRLKGTHTKYGAQTPVRLRGAAIRDLSSIFGRGGYVPFSKVFKTGTLGTFDGAASTNYDVDVEWLLPIPPQGIPLADQILYAVKGPEWAGDLHLEFDTGDGTSLGTTSGNITFSAYNSGSSSPQISVSLIRPCMTVALMNAITPGITFKTYRDLASILQAATFTGQKISDLNVGKGTTRLIQRTGTLQTSVSAGVNVMSAYSDSIITRAFPSLDGKPLKNPYSIFETKDYEAYALGNALPLGYAIHDWIEGGNVHSMFQSQSLTAARRFELDGDVTAASNQGGELIQEEILGSPVILPVAA
jgi:hypothetical protein